jgi:2-oxoglutarate dehydrogenase E1 component
LSVSAPKNTHSPHPTLFKPSPPPKKTKGEGIDWATAEALAFATLLSEGNIVRLSGQDVERGTFSHRHATIHDQETGAKYCSLEHVFPGQKPGQLTISNSSLSEFGVLGFELGFSMENPNSLVLWEAQFGDFANGAQIIFDQFLSSGEAKWLRQSGLVVLLPHGYDGQGPEHSSARLERFLQMSDESPYVLPPIDEKEWFTGSHLGTQTQRANWQVVNVTTPANYFHVLRRQVHRQFRKPLVVMAPKNLLRHPKCKSDLAEFDDAAEDAGIVGVRFKRVIMDDTGLMPKSRAPRPEQEPGFKRVVFCTGKVFYELHAERERLGLGGSVALVRVEQLMPFPFDLVCRELHRYPNAELVWCQEEPMNMGAYFHVQVRLRCLRLFCLLCACLRCGLLFVCGFRGWRCDTPCHCLSHFNPLKNNTPLNSKNNANTTTNTTAAPRVVPAQGGPPHHGPHHVRGPPAVGVDRDGLWPGARGGAGQARVRGARPRLQDGRRVDWM